MPDDRPDTEHEPTERASAREDSRSTGIGPEEKRDSVDPLLPPNYFFATMQILDPPEPITRRPIERPRK